MGYNLLSVSGRSSVNKIVAHQEGVVKKQVAMNRIFLTTIAFTVATVSLFCKSNPKEIGTTMPPDMHTSQISLDWAGTYRSVLSCADCQGIRKTIFLNMDGSYRLQVKYLGKQDSAREYAGNFSWNDKGSTITLNESGQPLSFFVGENTLTQLDIHGSRIEGDLAGKYILNKEQPTILNRHWKLTELMGKPVKPDNTKEKEPFIIFNEEGHRYSGNGGCNNFSGTFKLSDPNRITFAKGITTQMA
jgi:heat shock protein HslJ